MKRLLQVGAIFSAGVIFGLISVQGTFNHLRHTFSPSLSFADGSTYVGGVNAQGQLDGNGRLQWRNGDSYVGDFADGLFHGYGIFSSSASGNYRGNFVKGDMEGAGELIYEDGSRYQGEFKANQFHGKGKLIYADGTYYFGDFVTGRTHGKGQWVYPDKSTYVGDVVNGVLSGRGELSRSGNKYTGEFVAGKMHGKGGFVDKKGNTYSGEFANDSFSGQGVYKGVEGETSIGQFDHWVLNGEGMYTDKRGNQWQGEFVDGMLNGEGTYLAKQGVQYTGGFKYGQYDGAGKLIVENGDVYEGEFTYGGKHGAGTLTYKEPIDGVKKITGRWENNRLVDGGNDVRIFSAEEVSEHGLYLESAKLQAELDAVQLSNPDEVELYSLVIAGYGPEEVFHRESRFIENLFDTQYANSGTAIYLANSQRSLAEHPLATRTSIQRSIERIAERMDKGQDIFFLYITSHGGKNKTISLDHNGLALADIEAKWLGELLKKTGIQHRVVVLSACYSGGFIDEIKDDNSLIMTAASASNTSFGCSDDSLFTYFGKAYFKEALKPGVDFEQAFYQARSLVEIWEKEQKITPSEPQIQVNPQVTEHVKRWVKGRAAPVISNLKPLSPQ